MCLDVRWVEIQYQAGNPSAVVRLVLTPQNQRLNIVIDRDHRFRHRSIGGRWSKLDPTIRADDIMLFMVQVIAAAFRALDDLHLFLIRRFRSLKPENLSLRRIKLSLINQAGVKSSLQVLQDGDQILAGTRT